MKLFYVLIIFLLSTVCCASIYVQMDSDGNPTYSDAPLDPTAKPVVLPSSQQDSSVSSITSAPPRTTPAAGTVTEISNDERKPYTTFVILSPKNEETIQNQPNLNVSLKVEPELQAPDKIVIFLDSMPINPPSTSTDISLGFIERGEHTISAKLIDRNSQVLKESNTIKIYVQRIGVNFPARQGAN